jgi:hypothetical protein
LSRCCSYCDAEARRSEIAMSAAAAGYLIALAISPLGATAG